VPNFVKIDHTFAQMGPIEFLRRYEYTISVQNLILKFSDIGGNIEETLWRGKFFRLTVVYEPIVYGVVR